MRKMFSKNKFIIGVSENGLLARAKSRLRGPLSTKHKIKQECHGIYLQIAPGLHERFVVFFKNKGIKVIALKKDLLKVDVSLSQIYGLLNKNPIVTRYLVRVFYGNNSVNKIKDIFPYLKNKKIRVFAYPKSLQEKSLELFDKAGIELTPTGYDYALHLVESEGKYFFGLIPKRLNYQKIPDSQKTSRAYYKIKEVVQKTGLNFKGKQVLDLGAAPGGWCEYLKPLATRVVAVDPAVVTVQGDNIVHLKKKLEDIVPELKKQKFDVIICDINNDPMILLDSILKLRIKGVKVVLTLKFDRDNKKYIEHQIEQIKARLGPFSKHLDIAWLFANTVNERTLFCRFK